MATLPKPRTDLATVQLYITSQGQAQQPGINIGNGDSITFYNAAPFKVSIQFICANGPVFNDISEIDPGHWSPAQPAQKSFITTDYQITDLSTGNSQGLYAIQVGGSATVAAPLQIPISQGNPPAEMQTISVPFNGWIDFSLDASQYTCTWNPANAFTTPASPTPIVSGQPYRAQVSNAVHSATYTLTSLNARGVTGGGTVHINA
jgi:hypothetical protein